MTATLAGTYPVAMLSGHRSLPSAPAKWVRNELLRIANRLRDEHGTLAAISGMALGVDTQWAWAAHATGLDLWAHVPFRQQCERWTEQQKADWRKLRAVAAKEVVYGDLGDATGDARRGLAVRLLHARNDGMIAATREAEGIAIAVWDGRREGGTWSAVRKLCPSGLPLLWVRPHLRSTRIGIPDQVMRGAV